eukprot:11278126-Heterocapsa_arctica.AAC.1
MLGSLKSEMERLQAEWEEEKTARQAREIAGERNQAGELPGADSVSPAAASPIPDGSHSPGQGEQAGGDRAAAEAAQGNQGPAAAADEIRQPQVVYAGPQLEPRDQHSEPSEHRRRRDAQT